MNVAILYGGRSSEHEVSLVSAAGVLRELNTVADYDVVPIGIDRDGKWYRQDADEQLARAQAGDRLSVDSRHPQVVMIPGEGLALRGGDAGLIPVDCVFPVLHGSFGEDGTIQGLLEMAHLPYVGSGVVGSSVGMDKIRSKKLWQERGLPIVPYLTVRYAPTSTAAATELAHETAAKINGSFGFPIFVKPNAAGSSVGVSRVSGADQLAAALTRAGAVDSTILIEQALPVRELETAVLGDVTVRSFPPGEVIPTHEFYDYAAKYEDPDGADLRIPADIPEETGEEIQRISREAFAAIDGSGFARVDCFLHKQDGSVYLNEINTIPGFTPISMYPKLVEAGGLSYGALLQELIALALLRAEEQRRRNYAAR